MPQADEKEATTTPVSAFGRSVVDFVTEDELKEALSTVTPQGLATNDWILPVPDAEAEEQTLDGEMARLMTLKSYMLLDSDKEEAFDALTQEACKIFGVPTSLISLIDLGRQFLFSNTGADVRETTRAVAFCSHTILNKNGIVVVNDTKEDNRFKESPLVTQAPHLRFYAGAPLISPEGHKLGTFCVEGPEPRPEGLSEEEKQTLKDYAAKAMNLMVERRKNLRDRLSGNSISDELRRHAAVTTNLGDMVYLAGDSVTSMRLYQESVQTIMYVEEDGEGAKPDEQRQTAMKQFLALLSVETIPEAGQKEILQKIRALYTDIADTNKPYHSFEGIPGLFSVNSKLKGMNTPRPLPGLVFAETFKIDMVTPPETKKSTFPLDDQPFTVSLAECSKATLFNMALIHYHWGSPDMALQFFHLAASVSHKISPLFFDPVDLACVNNMAQIHLQYRRPEDALRMLTEALSRGNKTLAEMYSQTEDTQQDDENKMEEDGEDDANLTPEDEQKREEESARHTRRLRRKLSRTIMNMGHVHFYNCNYDAAMASIQQALPLLDNAMEGFEYAAAWYNMSTVYHHQGNHAEALKYLEKFLEAALKLNGPNHIQNADALYHTGQIQYELGSYDRALEPLQESLRIRKMQYGDCHGIVAESLGLIGKVELARQEFEAAVKTLKECVEIQHKLLQGGDLTFDAAHTLLDLGRAYQAKGDLKASLETYLEVMKWTRGFFGPEHAFVARIATIVGNLYVEAGQGKESKPFLQEAETIQKKLQTATG